MVGILSVFALLFFCVGYKRFNGAEIGFPIYIYFAMFPHKLRAFSVFSADDMILKVVLLADLVFLVLRKRKVKYNIHELLFLLVVAMVDIVAYIGERAIDQSLLVTGFVNILFMFVFSFAFLNRVKTEKGMETVFGIIQKNGAMLSVGAIFELIIYNADRAELGLSNPNYLGYYLAIAFCVFFYNNQKFRIKHISYGALLVTGIICTGSYSILFCLPVYILLKYVYGSTKAAARSLISKVLAVAFVFLAALIIWMSTSEGMLSIPFVQSILDDKDTGRLYIWEEALRSFRENPILGVGYNTWRSQYGIGYVTHNDFLRLLAETGLVGISTFLVYWFSLAGKIARSRSENQPFYMSIFLTVVMFSSFHNNVNSLMFWLVLSLPLYDDLVFAKKKKAVESKNMEGQQ